MAVGEAEGCRCRQYVSNLKTTDGEAGGLRLDNDLVDVAVVVAVVVAPLQGQTRTRGDGSIVGQIDDLVLIGGGQTVDGGQGHEAGDIVDIGEVTKSEGAVAGVLNADVEVKLIVVEVDVGVELRQDGVDIVGIAVSLVAGTQIERGILDKASRRGIVVAGKDIPAHGSLVEVLRHRQSLVTAAGGEVVVGHGTPGAPAAAGGAVGADVGVVGGTLGQVGERVAVAREVVDKGALGHGSEVGAFVVLDLITGTVASPVEDDVEVARDGTEAVGLGALGLREGVDQALAGIHIIVGMHRGREGARRGERRVGGDDGVPTVLNGCHAVDVSG